MKAAAKRGLQATGAAVPNNLPNYLTSFVGREGEFAAFRSLLARSRMVTLTGPGGAGKSRLAAELGRVCLGLWPEGLCWVELAPLNDPRQVPGAVVAALELPGRGPAPDVVIAWLATKRALLVLDNCEHLVAACADFCQAVLERCAELTIIATSREALGVSGETHWPVSSMSATDAVQLFEARARLVVPSFKVEATNLVTVTQICERLDGMPLAIELAATRVGMMNEQEILSQLSDRFRFLTGGNRTAPQRQQTMIATIDWSYRLLTEEETRLFRRLSVFRGGFTLESAQAVCAEGIAGSVLDLLAGLVQKSMVVAERTFGSASRYRLLESQLAYAEDRLREASELEFMRRRHYEYFRDCLDAKSGHPALPQPILGVAEEEWKARELSNLWAAAGWARNNADDLGLSFAVDLSRIQLVDKTDARSLLADLLARSPEKGVPRVKALLQAAWLAQMQGDTAGVHAADAGLVLAREVGDIELVAYALFRAGAGHGLSGEPGAAAEMYEEASSLLKCSTNRHLATRIQNNLAWLAIERGDCSAGRELLVECVAAARTDGDVLYTAIYLDSLGYAQLGLDDHQAAAASYKESLFGYRSIQAKRGIIICLQGLSCVAGASGDVKRAVRLAGAANRMSDEFSLKSDPFSTKNAEESLRQSRSSFGPRKSEEAWKEGWAMTVDQAIDYALGESGPESLIDAGPLSRREREVATLVATGLTNRQIAERLFIAERSAEGHVERIRNKLGVRSRTEVATWAVERGLMAAPIKERRRPS